MELHQRITNLVTKETDRLLKEFLNDNPDLLQKYVDGGVTAVGLILTPLNAFMRHLLVVKGLDPDEVPGERLRRELNQAITSLFDPTHSKDFDDDYDFSWVRKKFEETRSHMKDLTEERFKELTDLDKLPSIGPGRYPAVQEEQEYFSEYPSTRLPDKEVRVVDDQPTEFDRLRNSLKEIIKSAESAEKGETTKFDPGAAIEKLGELAKEVRKMGAKKGIKVGKKKANKGPDPKGPPAWGSKGVRVNRVQPTEQESKDYKAKRSSIKENIMAKHSAATKLVDEMVARGLCSNNAEAIREQVQQVLLMPDDAVEALGRVVSKHAKSGSSADRLGQGPFRRTQK